VSFPRPGLLHARTISPEEKTCSRSSFKIGPKKGNPGGVEQAHDGLSSGSGGGGKRPQVLFLKLHEECAALPAPAIALNAADEPLIQ
jgi:hypothetical protein